MRNTLLATGAFLALGLGVMYAIQDKLLYMPGMPIRHIRNNPRGYRSPAERGISFETVRLPVKGYPNDAI